MYTFFLVYEAVDAPISARIKENYDSIDSFVHREEHYLKRKSRKDLPISIYYKSRNDFESFRLSISHYKCSALFILQPLPGIHFYAAMQLSRKDGPLLPQKK